MLPFNGRGIVSEVLENTKRGWAVKAAVPAISVFKARRRVSISWKNDENQTVYCFIGVIRLGAVKVRQNCKLYNGYEQNFKLNQQFNVSFLASDRPF
jgi:hypothetical protein